MPDVEMPDGTIIQGVPDGISQADLMSRYQKMSSSNQEQPDSRSGFSAITQPISNFIQGQEQRGADLVKAVNAGQNPASTALQVGLHNIVGGLAQVPAAGIEMGARMASDMAPAIVSDMTPQPIKNALSSVGSAVAKPIEQGVSSLAKQYQQNQTNFSNDHPEAAANLQAVREGVNLLPFAVPEVRAATEAGAAATESAFKNVTQDAIKNTLESLKKDPIPTFETTKALSQADYARVESLGATYNPKIRQQYISAIKDALPGEEKVLPGDTTIERIYNNAIGSKDKPLTLQGIQQIDQELTDLKYDAVHPNGLPTAEGKRIADIQRTLRSVVDSAPEESVTGGKAGYKALQDANANWAASRKIYEINKIFQRAEMTDNPATSIKAGFRNLYLNDKRLSGYTPKERKLIKAAGQSSAAGNLLRTQVGSRLISAMIGTAAGSVGGIPGMAAGATIGAATGGTARAVAAAMQKGRANKVLREIGRNIRPSAPIEVPPTPPVAPLIPPNNQLSNIYKLFGPATGTDEMGSINSILSNPNK